MTIRIFHGLPIEPPAEQSYLTIANFDGVHLGHQAVVGETAGQAHAEGCLAGVLTFDPHPLAVLRPQLPLAYLTLMPEREDLLGLHGLDFVVILPFDREVASTSAADFVAALTRSVRPTFDNGARSVEAYLLNYRGDLYGQRLGLSFLLRLRPEERLPSVDALIAQMGRDGAATRDLLGNPRDDSATQDLLTPPWEELPHTADWAVRVYGGDQRQLFARAARAESRSRPRNSRVGRRLLILNH